jgi:hypothetical protein
MIKLKYKKIFVILRKLQTQKNDFHEKYFFEK